MNADSGEPPYVGDVDDTIYQELRAIAHRRLRTVAGDANSITLNTTALVHEAYLKLSGTANHPWRDRTHFLSSAAVAMRHILVDRARARASIKHGANRARSTLDLNALASDDEPAALLEIDDALDRLSTIAPRLARIVVLRFYGGLTDQEIADTLEITPRTVQRDWLKARALLQRALAP
jgi:RNA polymerase sigma factor (TIGR02999 family)